MFRGAQKENEKKPLGLVHFLSKTQEADELLHSKGIPRDLPRTLEPFCPDRLTQTKSHNGKACRSKFTDGWFWSRVPRRSWTQPEILLLLRSPRDRPRRAFKLDHFRVPVRQSAKGRALLQACQKMTIPTVRRRNSEWTRRSANPVSPAERTVKKRRAGIPKLWHSWSQTTATCSSRASASLLLHYSVTQAPSGPHSPALCTRQRGGSTFQNRASHEPSSALARAASDGPHQRLQHPDMFATQLPRFWRCQNPRKWVGLPAVAGSHKIKVKFLKFGQSALAICRCFYWMVRRHEP